MQAGVQVEVHHHEVATAGQNEIDMKFAPLTRMADNVMIYKYVCKNVARRHDKVATFMPKPIFADNASGMHCHQSLWQDKKNLFYDAERMGADLRRCAAGTSAGCWQHAPALMAFCAPTTNSYKRLVPGYEAPVNLAMSQRNRSAAARIPMYSYSPNARRVEFRCPDPSANAYLAFAAMLMAGLDGIAKKTEPGHPLDKNIYDLPPEEARKMRQVPGSLRGIAVGAGGGPRLPDGGRRIHQRRDRDLDRLQVQAARSIRCGCARIPGSSICTSTSEPAAARPHTPSR